MVHQWTIPFPVGFTASGGDDADKVRRGANARAEVTQLRDQKTGRTDASARGRHRGSCRSMDDGHQGSDRKKRPGKCYESLAKLLSTSISDVMLKE